LNSSFNLYLYKSKVFLTNNLKILVISFLVLIFSINTSNLILEIFFSESINNFKTKPISKNNLKISENPFKQNYEIFSNDSSLQSIKAPETSLSLKLFGVTSSANQNFAIIGLNSGDQKKYTEGESILDNVFLELIHKDYVTINRLGSSESLSFDSINLIGGIDENILTKSEKAIKNSIISSNWLSEQDISDLISFVPIFVDGVLSGLELNPGSDKKFFETFDLKPGDVLVSINGTKVSEFNQDFSNDINSLFLESKNIDLELLRNESKFNIGIDLN
jgi:type II secretion system protein C|tara:strand:- start:15217 stop:16047 length:831 start_codon:yes stop_codon:yes gene_type:complete